MKKESHPIGFRKYILFSFFGYRLRLHVWPTGQGTESRHNHRWWFVSMPLIGRFDDTRYREVEPSGDFVKIDVTDRDGMRDGERRYRQKAPSDLQLIKKNIRYPFVPYLCRLGEIHSYVPHGPGLHASLVFVGRLKKENSEIWRKSNDVDVQLDKDG